MIDKKTVTTSSTLLIDGGSSITISCDPNATVWLSTDGAAEVGKGKRLDIFCPSHLFAGLTGSVYAIAESGTADIGILA